MALQSPNLMMIGLGSWKDAPPNSEQPPLADAIHLRWAFKHNLGFPWFGFYLFRRLHNAGTVIWLSQATRTLQPGKWPSNILDTSQGQLSSDNNLVLTEDFPPRGSVEFDLDDRGYLRFAYPAQARARRVEASIGFRARPGDPPPTKNTVSFDHRPTGEGPNPRTEQGVIFLALDQRNQPRDHTFIRSVQTSSGTVTGLGCKFKLNITLPTAATFVEVILTGAGRRDSPDVTPTVEAFNQDGTRAGIASMKDPGSRQAETFMLSGSAITRVVINENHPQNDVETLDAQDRVILNEISYGQAAVSDVSFTAFAEGTPVGRVDIRGYAGRIVSGTIEFDGISSVEFSSAPAALIDLGTVPLFQDATAGWARLTDFTYPMRLPITHSDYPCTPGMSEDLAGARTLARSRIQYGDPNRFTSPPTRIPTAGTVSVTNGSPIVIGTGTNWNNTLLDVVLQVGDDPTVYTIVTVLSATRLVLSRNYAGTTRSNAAYTISRDSFGQLYNYLASLVTGGSAAGAMADRTLAAITGSGPGNNVPRMPAQAPLDMVLLGTLHPAVAQMVGLYWADRTTDRAQSYDYLIVADYTGAGGRNADQVLAMIQQSGFSNFDGYIVYNLRMSTAPMLAAPDQLQVYAIPGSSRETETGTSESSINNAGLRWNLNKTSLGVLLPGLPVMYHLWRADLGNGVTPSAASGYNIISRDRPILVIENGVGPLRARDWPPFPLHAMDNALADGWHSYQVSGIDVFGRHTPNSTASAWRQWAPRPEPRPWYYQDPPSDAVINASAVRLLVKIPPPPPTGIEAYALDPQDPTVVRDAAFMAWWNELTNTAWYRALSDAQKKNLIGLRVRWLWSDADMIQAPNTREFRIYYQPGQLNALLGNTRAVTDSGTGESDVTTDIPNNQHAGSHVGCSLHAGEDAFVIVGSDAAGPLRVRVRNLARQRLVMDGTPRSDVIPALNVPCTVAIPPTYSAGTAQVTSGSQAVSGVNTGWTTALAGMLFRVATDETSYRIVTVDSQTQLTLEQAYGGPTRQTSVAYSIRHPQFIDYALPANWQTRYYIVDVSKNWTAGTDSTGRPVRKYEIFLPVPQDTVHDGLPLSASLAEPIAYAHIGVSAADDKTYTSDDPKWSGRWAGRIGNEGRVGPPAKIFRVLRESPPVPLLPPMPERFFATRGNFNGVSFYTYRWRPTDRLLTHVFRALDDGLFKVDWPQRPRSPLDASQVQFFPDAATDPRWNTSKRQQVATELNQLNSFARDAAGTAQAFAYYRGLSADSLRVLAGLPGNETAFTRLTAAPLDPNDPATENRRGPDDPDKFKIGDPNNPLASPSLRIFIDTLDGRATSRHFYRAAYVDGVHNPSNTLSLATPPVSSPAVVPPEAPLAQLALTAEKKVRLQWTASPSRDLARYHIYRAANEEAALDVRTMTRVASVVPTPGTTPPPGEEVPSPVPGKPGWLEYANPAEPGQTWFYRIVAVDTSGNLSKPSSVLSGHSYQPAPEPPALAVPVWDSSHKTVGLSWSSPDNQLASLVERRQQGGSMWTAPIWMAVTGWLPRGVYNYVDKPPNPSVSWEYRIKVQDTLGQVNSTYNTRTTP